MVLMTRAAPILLAALGCSARLYTRFSRDLVLMGLFSCSYGECTNEMKYYLQYAKIKFGLGGREGEGVYMRYTFVITHTHTHTHTHVKRLELLGLFYC